MVLKSCCFFYLDRFFVKSEISECSPTLTLTATAFKNHMLMRDEPVSFNDFKVLTSSNSDFHLKIKESLLIALTPPSPPASLHLGLGLPKAPQWLPQGKIWILHALDRPE